MDAIGGSIGESKASINESRLGKINNVPLTVRRYLTLDS